MSAVALATPSLPRFSRRTPCDRAEAQETERQLLIRYHREGDTRRMTLLFFQICGGAAGRVPEGATAFAHRYALANMMAVSGWTHGAQDSAEHIEATRRYWKTLEPFTRGFYVNDMPREATAKDINANYRGNYDRLVAVKAKYDPTNLFRLNANVQPTHA